MGRSRRHSVSAERGSGDDLWPSPARPCRALGRAGPSIPASDPAGRSVMPGLSPATGVSPCPAFPSTRHPPLQPQITPIPTGSLCSTVPSHSSSHNVAAGARVSSKQDLGTARKQSPWFPVPAGMLRATMPHSQAASHPWGRGWDRHSEPRARHSPAHQWRTQTAALMDGLNLQS